MMKIGPVRMRVGGGFVLVRMGMLHAFGKACVRVRVMSIVMPVQMLVAHRHMRVHMLVTLAEE